MKNTNKVFNIIFILCLNFLFSTSDILLLDQRQRQDYQDRQREINYRDFYDKRIDYVNDERIVDERRIDFERLNRIDNNNNRFNERIDDYRQRQYRIDDVDENRFNNYDNDRRERERFDMDERNRIDSFDERNDYHRVEDDNRREDEQIRMNERNERFERYERIDDKIRRQRFDERIDNDEQRRIENRMNDWRMENLFQIKSDQTTSKNLLSNSVSIIIALIASYKIFHKN